MGRTPGRKNTLKWKAREYLLLHPTASNRDVVRVVGCSDRMVSLVRAGMRADGSLIRAASDYTSLQTMDSTEGENKSAADEFPTQNVIPGLDPVSTKTLLSLVEEKREEIETGGHEWPVEEQLSFLRRLGKTHDNPQVRMAALALYNKISSDQGQRDALGPGEPLNDTDRVVRLSLLMEACGPRVVLLAYEKAFKISLTKGADDAVDEAPSPVTASQDAVETGHEDHPA
jgi:hypothetical protein